MELPPSSLISHLFISNLSSLSYPYLCAAYNLPTTRRSPSSIEPCCRPTESHESGDCLAMDGQEQETTGKRKTKNSTSLVEGDRDLAKAKKESESMAKKDEKLRKKEEKALEYALLVSGLEARRRNLVDYRARST